MPKVRRAAEGHQAVQIYPWQSKRKIKTGQLDEATVIVGMSIKRSAPSACRANPDTGKVRPNTDRDQGADSQTSEACDIRLQHSREFVADTDGH